MPELKSLRIPAILSSTVLLVLLAGCAGSRPLGSSTPALDQQFGESVRQLRTAQTLDPDATARNLGKTTQLDGQAASEATERYQDSFREPPPTFTILGAPIQGQSQ